MKSIVEQVDTEELLKILGKEAPVGICVIQDGKIRCFNANFPIAIGYTADELIGKDSLMIVVPEDREMVRKNTRKMLKGDLRSPYQFRVTDKDGGIVWIMATVKSIQYHGRRATLGCYMEVTERKQVEEQIRESERHYRLLAENAEDVIWTVDIARPTRLTYISPSVTCLLGYSVEEVMTKEMRAVFTAPSFDIAMKAFAEETASERKAQSGPHRSSLLDLQLRHKNGSLVDVEVNFSLIRGAYGQRDEILAVARNISGRKQIQEALGDSEERYRELADSITDVFFAMDEHLRYTYWNRASETLTGIRAEDAIGKSIREIFPDRPGLRKAEKVYRSSMRTHQPQTFLTDYDLNGGHHVFEISTYPSRGGISVFVKDITERKRFEEALKQSEERYRTILDEMGDGYFETDLAGSITFANDALINLLGYSKEELIGMNFRALRPGKEAKGVFEAYNRMYKTGEPLRNFSSEIICKDARHVFAETSAFPIRNDEGKIVGFRGIRHDITERKSAEEALRQSEEKYRTILEEMEDAYFEVDLGGHLTFVNNSLCRDLGYSQEELIGKSYKDLTAQEDIDQIFRVFNEVYQSGVPNKGFAWKTVRKDGAQGFAETSISLLRNDKGETVGFRGVGRDIAERKRAEEKLRQSEENYRTLFNSSVIGMYVLDVETMKVVMGNRAAAGMAGFNSVGEGIGINPFDFVIPEARDQVLERAAKEFEQDLQQTHELPVITKDGGTGWISVSSAKITHNGRLAALVSFVDITERKRMEEALRQSEENYRALFDSSVIGTIVLDAETMKVVMANQAAAKIFGFSSPQEGIGRNPLDFIPPEDRDSVSEIATKQLFEQDLRTPCEFRAITKDGRQIWISATGVRIRHEGRLAGLISFADITEQKLQNDKLTMTDRLVSIGELAAGAAHELNNPLASIIGLSELLMERNTPDYIRNNLAMIRDEARRAANVTSSLLTFARKHRPAKRLTEINAIIEDVLKLRAYAHKSNCIEVERHLTADLPEIPADPFQMQQVFLNIVMNAEYFMMQAHNRGTLTITTKTQDGSVMVSFADDGLGIPPENMSRIFDPFFTTKEAGKGTGLGLSVCHGIIAAHGGQIYARSQLGKETIICIELPTNGSSNAEAML